MKKYNMNTIYNQLKESPLLYLSGGSKELFHSNFLYWLGINYRQVFEQLMSWMLGISGVWPQGKCFRSLTSDAHIAFN